MKGLIRALVIIQLIGAMFFIAPTGMAIQDTVTIDGQTYVLTATTPFYIVVPESVEVGQVENAYIAGRITGSVSLRAPMSINLYNMQNNSKYVKCNVTMGTGNILSLTGTGEVAQVSSPIVVQLAESPPRFGDFRGTLTYTVTQNIAKDISGYLNYSLSATGDYYTITGVNDTSMFDYCNNKVYIPVSYNGKPVKAIGANAFSAASGKPCNPVAYHKRTVTFNIPPSIEEIGERAFAFFGDKNTRFVFTGPGLKKIGKAAFERCWFTSFTLPDSVTELGEDAFSYCSYLTSTTLPPNLRVLGKNAYNYCSALAGAIYVPPSVTSAGMSAFQSTKITALTWDASTTEIPYGCFKNCSKLTTAAIGPVAMTHLSSIARYAFSGTKISQIVCPHGTTYASDSFPSGCTITYS